MRIRSATACVLTAGLLGACHPAPESDPAPIIDTNRTILAFGDSLTFGTGASKELSYPAFLEKQIRVRVVNGGAPGEHTEEGVRRLAPVLNAIKPDIMILWHGANDLRSRPDPEAISANLEKMILEARTRDIAVVLVNAPEYGNLLEPHPLYKELANRYDLPYREDLLLLVVSDSSYMDDNIHPNSRGYWLIAQRIAALLREHGLVPNE